tara:strand:- start:4448 stop:4954 length:507 start_codon:yes stop_codon:yes gene_type:complete
MTKLQWFVSLTASLFLFAMAVIPNGYSYFYAKYQNTIIPITNTINVTYNWQFFAPNPPPAIYYDFILWRDNEFLGERTIPDGEAPFFFRANYSRRVTIKNTLMKFPDLVYTIFAPYYCSLYPEANYIQIKKTIVEPLSIDDAKSGKRDMLDESKTISEDLGYEECKHG